MWKLLIGCVLAASLLQAEGPDRKAVDKALKPIFEKSNIPGVIVGIIQDGKPYYFYYGFADWDTQRKFDENTLFEIGSNTKMFTAAATMVEVRKGNVDMDGPLSVLIPAFKNTYMGSLTPKEILNHTAGLPRNVVGLTTSQWFKFNDDLFVDYYSQWYPPYWDDKVRYSNIGYAALGIGLERHLKKPLEAIMKEDVFDPLGMSATSFEISEKDLPRYARTHDHHGNHTGAWPVNSFRASGALRSTPKDLLTFIYASLGHDNKEKPYPAHLKKSLLDIEKGASSINTHIQSGLGWMRVESEGDLFVHQIGTTYGHSSYMGMIPAKKVGVVILVNRKINNLSKIGMEILNSLKEKESDG